METETTPQSTAQERPKRRPPEKQKPAANPETKEEIVQYMRNGGNMVFGPSASSILEQLMTETDMATLNSMDRSYQRQLFLTMARDDPRRTLEHSFLFIDKPYGAEVIEQAALKDPQAAAEVIRKNPDDPKLQRLHQILKTRLGTQKLQEMEMEEEMGFFRWLTIKLFGHDEGEPAPLSARPYPKPEQVKKEPAPQKEEKKEKSEKKEEPETKKENQKEEEPEKPKKADQEG